MVKGENHLSKEGDGSMLNLLKTVMKNGYVDEHGHKLYGAAAIAHFIYCPVKSIDPKQIERGKKIVQKYLNR